MKKEEAIYDKNNPYQEGVRYIAIKKFEGRNYIVGTTFGGRDQLLQVPEIRRDPGILILPRDYVVDKYIFKKGSLEGVLSR